MGNELVDFSNAHFTWVTFMVVEDVLTDPAHVGIFSAVGVVFEAQCFAELVERFVSHEVL